MRLAFERREPVVTLRNAFSHPYDGAIAAARTCYSPDVVGAEEITPKQRETIGPLTFNAGHHTIYQHATFEFGLENVSRHLVWAVLHSFPFYNTDQQSQRYVRQNEVRAFLPPIEGQALELYRSAILDSFETYQRLGEILKGETLRIIGNIRHYDRHPHERLRKKIDREADKKAIEVARYVLPIATHTSMVYTVSGLVLHRLRRMMHGGDLPFESSRVIGQMVRVVEAIDPDFFSKVGEPPLEREDIFESTFVEEGPSFDANEWDRELEGQSFSRLVDYTQDAEKWIARSVRLSLGKSATSLSDVDWVALALDPKKNPYRVEKINLGTHSPILRSLQHVYYTFYKRLSHSADSQNQRHRMVPGSRPLYQLMDSAQPDFYVPLLIEKNSQARDIYEAFMKKIWKTKNDLLEMGVSREFALYVLPNATQVRFVESGSLLHLLHKWTQRTCLNAQEEIFRASMEEIRQVIRVHPFLAKYIGPPCVIRNNVVSPKCTEGDHFCGVPVWNSFPNIERAL